MAATFADVEAIVAELPEVTEGARYGMRTWFVGKSGFAWERPLSKADVKRLDGAPVPEGDLLALRTEDLAEKEAILAAGTKGVFTITHFDGYPSILVQLKVVTKKALRELVLDAWLACAPENLAKEHLASRKRAR